MHLLAQFLYDMRKMELYSSGCYLELEAAFAKTSIQGLTHTHTHTQIIFPIRRCSLKLIYSCTHKYILFMLTAIHHLNISNGAKWCRDNNEMRHKPQDILILQVTGSSLYNLALNLL